MLPLLPLVFVAAVTAAPAQVVPWPQPAQVMVCDMPVPTPASAPQPGAPPAIVALLLCFDRQGGVSSVDPATYLHYVQLKPSEASRNLWREFDDDAVLVAKDDFARLWATGFLADLEIETVPYTFTNGAAGVVVVYRLEERPRVKLVEFDGLEGLSQSDVLEAMKAKGLTIRLDAFLDQTQVRKAATVIREQLAEKGFPYAEVTPSTDAVDGSPLLTRVRFVVSAGPRVAIRAVQFVGNTAFRDDELQRLLTKSRPRGLLSLMGGGGTYSEDDFAEDAVRIEEFYKDHGYLGVRVGRESLRVLDDSSDGRTRWVQLRVPVTEGQRFAVGTVTVEGETVFPEAALASLFRLTPGSTYRQERLRKGFEQARELYGSLGYFQFTGYPEITPRPGSAEPVADITVHLTEGKPYSVRRIEFKGNTLTRDSVIRRELAVIEGGLFNTEALKVSVRRLNQLGFFKPIEDTAVDVQLVGAPDGQVDVTIAVEEQNRNQLQFGAGMSQYQGFFGNASFTTANLLGRGESLTIAGQIGSRVRDYQLSLTEPFIFGRPISVGSSLFSRKVDYALGGTALDYSEVRSGGNLTTGLPWRRFTRLFFTYGYEVVDTAMSDALAETFATSGGTGLTLMSQEGRFTESSVRPSIVMNTVDNPFTPRRGLRLTASYQYAGGWLGGTNRFMRPEGEAIVYLPLTRRTALGLRANAGAIWNMGRQELPFYQRYFLGGEQQIRGFNIRSVGPLNDNNAVTGGTRFAVFNAELYYDLMPRVRALLFHDAGQAFAEREALNLLNLRTSTGAEVRVNVPVLNMPFRLIYAVNLYRDAFQPPRTFRVSVGTTF